MLLDRNALYTFSTRRGAVEQDTIFKTIRQWLGTSPVNLTLKKVEAGFVYDTVQCYTDSLHFTTEITGGLKPYTYHWNFGNDSIATDANPSMLYNSAGTYNVMLIVTDNTGCSDTDNVFITVNAIPLICGTPIGDTSICINAANTIYTTTGATYSTYYSWEINPSSAGFIINNDTSATVDWDSLFSGTATIKVQGMSSCGDGPVSDSLNIYVIPLLATPGTISGTDTICPGLTGQTYSISSVTNATTYSWSVPIGWTITAGAGTTYITVTTGSAGQNGKISVTAGNSCGTSSADSLAVTVSPATPATPGAISGTATQCPGLTGQTYSISTVTNATTYTWSVPIGWTITAGAGTTSITVTTGSSGQNGNITVTAGNSCGTSSASSLAVTVNPAISATPETISGTASQCPGLSGQTYSISAVTDATTYTWSVPTGWTITDGTGTTSITVTTGSAGQNGNITVTAGNSCGTSSASSLAVTLVTCGPTCGSQVWAAANENKGTFVTKYNNQSNNNLVEKYCLNDVEANCATYGGLYRWAEMMQVSYVYNSGNLYPNTYTCDPCSPTSSPVGMQGICDAGYHIPSDKEWSRYEHCIESTITPTGSTSLTTFQTTLGDRGTNSNAGTGAKMKGYSSAWPTYWTGTNTSGFDALPTGYLEAGSSYFSGWTYLTVSTCFWTGAQDDSNMSLYRALSTNKNTSYRWLTTKTHGFSVRCLKD